MTKTIIFTIIFFTSILTLLSSCGCDCDCEKKLGCKILTIKLTSNDSIILIKKYCSQTNFTTDQTLQDSVAAFFLHYNSDTTTITRKDSIYKIYETVNHLKCDETGLYKKNGYGCFCSK